MTEIMEHARKQSFEQDQERYNRILESQKAQRDAQMDDLHPLSERQHRCSPHRLPALFRFAALAILFVGLLLTIRAVNDGATMDTATAKTLPGPDSVHRSHPPAPSTSLPGSSLLPPNAAAPSVVPPNVAPPPSPGSVFVYLGNGCFWERQWAYVEIETHTWQRAAVNVSSKVGYAGGSRAGASGRVCYHCGLMCPDDYATLGHAEVVQARLAADGLTLTPTLAPTPTPTPPPTPAPTPTPTPAPTSTLTPTRCASTRPRPRSRCRRSRATSSAPSAAQQLAAARAPTQATKAAPTARYSACRAGWMGHSSQCSPPPTRTA
jgi:hypothetical protein